MGSTKAYLWLDLVYQWPDYEVWSVLEVHPILTPVGSCSRQAVKMNSEKVRWIY